jgi:hypothetical protein
METDKAHKKELEAFITNIEAKDMEIAKIKTFVKDQEIRNRDVVQTMSDKISSRDLEIQSLKDNKLASNGASRVTSGKPKKQGKKYTKKAAKTTASA